MDALNNNPNIASAGSPAPAPAINTNPQASAVAAPAPKPTRPVLKDFGYLVPEDLTLTQAFMDAWNQMHQESVIAINNYLQTNDENLRIVGMERMTDIAQFSVKIRKHFNIRAKALTVQRAQQRATKATERLAALSNLNPGNINLNVIGGAPASSIPASSADNPNGNVTQDQNTNLNPTFSLK